MANIGWSRAACYKKCDRFRRLLMSALWAPPIFASEEQTRQARLLHIIAWSTLFIVIGAMLLESILLPYAVLRWCIITALTALVSLSASALNRRERTRQGAYLVLAAAWLISSVTALTAGGIRAPALTTHLCLVLMAGLLLGNRAGITMGIVCALTGLAMVVIEALGWLPTNREIHTSLSLWC